MTRRYFAHALVASVLFLSVLSVRADIPVHCRHGQTLGVWTFNLGDNSGDSSELCGYQMPDDNVQHFTSYKYQLSTKSTFDVLLSEPNVATVVGSDIKGTWTMVYDEGFEVKIDGKVFFAFFAYEPKSFKSLKSSKNEFYTSHCEKSMVGWFHGADNKNWGCYQAQKKGQMPWAPPQFNVGGSLKQQLEDDAIIQPLGLLELGAQATFSADMSLIESINADTNSLWQAGVPSELLGKTESELAQMAGQSDKAELQVEAAKSVREGVLRGQSRGTGSHWFTEADEALLQKYNLPASVDWRNKDNLNWAGDVRSQGKCGSCFAFAMAYQAESRLRIKSKNRDHVVFSPQQMLSCSVTNQGCNGGYPYLLAKHAHEIGMMPESCFPYSRTADCAQGCKDSDLYFADANYGYVGGYYGASEEIGMMQELATNGPFTVALQVPRALFYYKTGIFVSNTEGEKEKGWAKTNHAVTVVGYGTDSARAGRPVKYWIVKNTWGPRWGNQGYFKVVRGSNNCAIETMPVVFQFNRKMQRGVNTPILLQLQAVQAKASALQTMFRQSLMSATSDADKDKSLRRALRAQVELESQIHSLQEQAEAAATAATSFLEVGQEQAQAQTQAVHLNLEHEVTVAQEFLAAADARVHALTTQAESMYANGQADAADTVDQELNDALAQQSAAEAKLQLLQSHA